SVARFSISSSESMRRQLLEIGGLRWYGRVNLRSRNNKDFNGRYPPIVNALTALPDETVIDGELVALDQEGRALFQSASELPRSADLLYMALDLLGGAEM
ncbi:MAG TPA: hypothetical protein VKD28_00775, partial [Gemmatimonadales bacterium]|nr:hypothetical protein [Gemmatimonadales bacterium]